jgi:hypothetical protein
MTEWHYLDRPNACRSEASARCVPDITRCRGATLTSPALSFSSTQWVLPRHSGCIAGRLWSGAQGRSIWLLLVAGTVLRFGQTIDPRNSVLGP